MDNVNNENVIHVTIKGRVATADKNVYVCGNSGYEVHFVFDSEWSEHKTKTARFVCDDATYYDVLFDDAVCPVPILSNTRRVRVGVFAGDLITTTPAYITAAKSILCDGGVPADPPDDVYSQLMEKLNRMEEENQARIDEALAETEQRISEVSDALAENTEALGEKIATLGNETTAQFEVVAKSLSDQASAIEEIHEQGVALAEQDEVIITRTEALEKRFADMDYGNGIEMTSFGHGVGTKERGQEVTSFTLSWALDRNPATQNLTGPTLDDGVVTLEISDRSYPISGVKINADNQQNFRWTITATDSRNKVVSRTSPGFTFLNCVYYGMAEQPDTIDDAFIRALATKTSPTSTRARSFTAVGDGTFIWYCLPTGLGKCTFTSAGFPAAFTLVDTYAFTNALGYKENYYVYRSDERINKTIPIGVS